VCIIAQIKITLKIITTKQMADSEREFLVIYEFFVTEFLVHLRIFTQPPSREVSNEEFGKNLKMIMKKMMTRNILKWNQITIPNSVTPTYHPSHSIILIIRTHHPTYSHLTTPCLYPHSQHPLYTLLPGTTTSTPSASSK
jgi:hypothetical protein